MSRELLQQALDALNTAMNAEGDVFGWQHNDVTELIGAIEIELSKPEPEPVAWMHHISDNNDREQYVLDFKPAHGMAVYGGDIPLYRREDV
jgi:hypothetical protein